MSQHQKSVGDPKAFAMQSTKLDRTRNPDLDNVRQTLLSDGPRYRRVAKYWTIINRRTGLPHHESLNISTYRKFKKAWSKDRLHSVSITTETADELDKIVGFIAACRGKSSTAETGRYVIAKVDDTQTADQIQVSLDKLSATGKGETIAKLLKQASDSSDLIDALIQQAESDPELFAKATAALNLAKYRRGAAELKRLIETSAKEQKFQELLTEHPWMFGSEYNERLARRTWSRNQNTDFMMRRTADDYIEVVEIKTPAPALFNEDKSHDCHYPSGALSAVLGQVQNYIEFLEMDRLRIRAIDGVDTAKIRAKIIIGRDAGPKEQQALRRLNGHLHRIEVITFDQLSRIAGQVISHIGSALQQANSQPDETMPDPRHADTPTQM